MKYAKPLKWLLTLACLLAALCSFALAADAEIVDSGYCGAEGEDGHNLTWTLDDTGTLTVSGNGAMEGGRFSIPAPECLNTVIIEEGVTTIGHFAFSELSGLSQVIIPDSVTTVGVEAFENCTGLTDVRFGNNVKCIEEWAFFGCCGLTELELPDSLSEIGAHAFNGCTGLVSVSIPAGVTIIGANPFSDCTGLENITVDPNNTTFFSVNNCVVKKQNGELVFGCKNSTIPEDGSIKKIAGQAFRGTKHMLIIPDCIQAIEYDEFLPRVYYTGTEADWERIDKSIGFLPLFYNCFLEDGIVFNRDKTEIQSVYDNSIKAVEIPASVSKIRVQAFDGCENLIEFDVDVNNPAYSSENGVLYNKEMTEIVRYPSGKDDAMFNVPKTVTAIAEKAFSESQYLSEISIPSHVKSLGKYCFAQCKNLKNVFCGTTEVPENMFFDCQELTEVTLYFGVSRIGPNAFSRCPKLEKVTMSNDIDFIGENAFVDCLGLTDVFYNGTADEWTAIGIKTGNEALNGARKHFGAVLTPHKPGDVDGDGKLTSSDARLALRAAVGLTGTYDVVKDSDGYIACDVDGDGKVTSADARLILRASVGLEDASKFGKKA